MLIDYRFVPILVHWLSFRRVLCLFLHCLLVLIPNLSRNVNVIHLTEKLDCLDIVPNSRATDFSPIISVFVFHQECYYVIDNPVWISFSLLYKYPAKLLSRPASQTDLVKKYRSLVEYRSLVTGLFNV
jgi:hypothetical protein